MKDFQNIRDRYIPKETLISLDNELIWTPRSRIDKRNYQIQINRFSSIHAHRLVICRDSMRDQHIVVCGGGGGMAYH